MRQRNVNFRQSGSERSAEGSYSNFKKSMVRKLRLDKFMPKPKGK